jgi:hypothetical protein
LTTIPHEQPRAWWMVTDLWASLAITAMWVAVSVAAIAGPNITSNDGSIVPAAIPLALFATLGTWIVAHYGFRRR